MANRVDAYHVQANSTMGCQEQASLYINNVARAVAKVVPLYLISVGYFCCASVCCKETIIAVNARQGLIPGTCPNPDFFPKSWMQVYSTNYLRWSANNWEYLGKIGWAMGNMPMDACFMNINFSLPVCLTCTAQLAIAASDLGVVSTALLMPLPPAIVMGASATLQAIRETKEEIATATRQHAE